MTILTINSDALRSVRCDAAALIRIVPLLCSRVTIYLLISMYSKLVSSLRRVHQSENKQYDIVFVFLREETVSTHGCPSDVVPQTHRSDCSGRAALALNANRKSVSSWLVFPVFKGTDPKAQAMEVLAAPMRPRYGWNSGFACQPCVACSIYIINHHS